MLDIDKIIEYAIKEDIPDRDITSDITVDENTRASAEIISRQDGVICSGDIVIKVFNYIDKDIEIKYLKNDGDVIKNGEKIFTISGNAKSILAAERTALNFLGKLSGISTLTKKFIDKCDGLDVKILDTRKTTPMYRELEKYAVKCGGGVNHRMNLSDGILVKENHIAFAGGLKNVIDKLKKNNLLEKAEIEVRNLEEFEYVLKSGIKYILLDNFTINDMKKAVDINNKYAVLEASGGITIDNVRKYAETGVDRISVGALTHSAKVLDFSLLFK